MPKLCYQRQDNVLVIPIANITVGQIIDMVRKEFPDLGQNPDPKKIGIMYKNGEFGIVIIETSDQPYHIP